MAEWIEEDDTPTTRWDGLARKAARRGWTVQEYLSVLEGPYGITDYLDLLDAVGAYDKAKGERT